MKTVLFIIPALTGGGSERVIINILNNIDNQRFNPILAFLKNEGSFVKEVPKGIKVIDLKCTRTRYSFIKVATLIWKLKPHSVLSTLGHLNLLIAILRKFLPKNIFYIARESSTVSLRNKEEKFPWLYNFLYRNIYENFDRIICQSAAMKEDLITNFNIDPEKMVIIHNPIDFKKINTLKVEKIDALERHHDYVISAGRLIKEKGFDRLIQAISLINNKNIKLLILGDGEDKNRLVEITKKLKLRDRVLFLGFKDNPYKYFQHCKLFLLGSYREGFPNVVLEANACGIPAVCYSCPGVDEIIHNGVNGFIVKSDDIFNFARTVELALDYDFDKKRITDLTETNYDAGLIVRQYENFF